MSVANGEENPIDDDLPEILAQAQVLIDQGDSNDALVVLTAITKTCVEEWDEVSDYGCSYVRSTGMGHSQSDSTSGRHHESR
ncbi:hypothetical protein [Chamaesiphon sp. VAR_48_metabat_135_sub]|uniref:hypothetical protein n=1 Tax=Chamaesiphon sp. VAR_48_metabat_135_sub TaxID=2964699 RepID=UPI00286BB251|nr:hypothetical protein [Chamaesiphon sp. VAR_48_metabat_135_sub]